MRLDSFEIDVLNTLYTDKLFFDSSDDYAGSFQEGLRDLQGNLELRKFSIHFKYFKRLISTYLLMHYEFYDVAMNLQSIKCVTINLYDDAYHANMQSHNAREVQ